MATRGCSAATVSAATRRRRFSSRRSVSTPWRRALLTLVRKGGSRTQLAGALAFAAATALVVSPVTMRNWRATGEFVLISSHGGLNLLIGNGPQADGTFTRVMDIQPTITGQWL